MKRLAEQGVAVIIISHNLADVFEVADHINVLYLGQMVASLDARETTRDDVVGYITGTKIAAGSNRMSTQKGPAGALATETSATAISADLIGSGQEGNIGDQVRAYLQRVRSGEMGALPAVGGFIVLTILFSFLSPFFLTERNFANLLTQAATLVMLGMALVFVLLLGEIDLSAGVTSGMTMALFIVLVNVNGVPWPIALAVAFAGRHPHRHVHRILRREGGHPILRRDAGPVPRAIRASRC